jgi:enamine deaminase RidA (YjgF/YER057c/UK114 family)
MSTSRPCESNRSRGDDHVEDQQSGDDRAARRHLQPQRQVGVRPDGSIPDSFEEQHEQVWKNTLAILADAGMGPEDIVRITVYSTDPEGRQYLKAHREKYLKPGHTPGSTWIVISQLANPKLLVEMETVAAKA